MSLVRFLKIPPDFGAQRLDNFLSQTFSAIPKSRIYRAIRDGEIRVNKKKSIPNALLKEGDELRIPPFMNTQEASQPTPRASNIPTLSKQLEPVVLFENQHFMIISKPSGIAVHGGSGLSFGVIEWFRHHRPELPFLELVHRIDRDTSGLLLIAKKRSALIELHERFRLNQIKKNYLALVHGHFSSQKAFRVDLALHKFLLPNGERRVSVDPERGKSSQTLITPIDHTTQLNLAVSLCMASPKTGRTHQIRAHLNAVGHPIVFDDKYGERDQDKNCAVLDFKSKRLMLHAWRLSFDFANQTYCFEADIPKEFLQPFQNITQKIEHIRPDIPLTPQPSDSTTISKK